MNLVLPHRRVKLIIIRNIQVSLNHLSYFFLQSVFAFLHSYYILTEFLDLIRTTSVVNFNVLFTYQQSLLCCCILLLQSFLYKILCKLIISCFKVFWGFWASSHWNLRIPFFDSWLRWKLSRVNAIFSYSIGSWVGLIHNRTFVLIWLLIMAEPLLRILCEI